MPAARLDAPVVINGRNVLEDGGAAIWFTFPGAWHDIGLFHLRDDTFTGVYANAITPVHFVDTHTWETTDLFLDYWIGVDGQATVLDADELAEASTRGWLNRDAADRARLEIDGIARAAARGEWPPEIVKQWNLDRARRTATPQGTPPHPRV
jgi:predicted RNA-binding protein associated with RNAse of E/G family